MGNRNKATMEHVLKWVWNVLGSIGIVAILGCLFNFDAVQHWIVQPRLAVKILSWHIERDALIPLGNIEGLPAQKLDKLVVKLNVEPTVRYHLGSFPVNQVQSIAIRKEDWSIFHTEDPTTPFNVKDEPIAITLKAYWFPVERSPGEAVHISVTDRWGHISSDVIKDADLIKRAL
jgi:hypothetical protein